MDADQARAPADCCTVGPDPRIAQHFDQKMRDRLAAGELPAIHPVSRRLLAALDNVGEERPTVLELGCGSGGVTVTLLEGGAASATGIDLSTGSIDTARRRAGEAGVSDRVRFEVGDGATVQLELHDWVVLDRVICCYGDADGLVANTSAAARRRYAFSTPDSRGVRGILSRIWFRIDDLGDRLRGRPCPGYVHDLDRIEAHLLKAGFRLTRRYRAGLLWQVAVFDR